ncbi:hypothetical protein ACFWWC_48570 [Streptomyces sp. NPDC058642]|uniref:nSTAND1 domain-containing NTPase n=1 Tax=Streptomyces sp. NPDC058642 TaxID=3346572 RepID=UPI0036607B1D
MAEFTQAVEVTIAHEERVTAWPRLSQEISDHCDGLRIRQRLTDAVDNWEHASRERILLNPGASLSVASGCVEQVPGTAGAMVTAFLEASQWP